MCCIKCEAPVFAARWPFILSINFIVPYYKIGTTLYCTVTCSCTVLYTLCACTHKQCACLLPSVGSLLPKHQLQLPLHSTSPFAYDPDSRAYPRRPDAHPRPLHDGLQQHHFRRPSGLDPGERCVCVWLSATRATRSCTVLVGQATSVYSVCTVTA